MQFTFNIPGPVVDALNGVFGKDLGRAAIEHFALEGYKSGMLSRYQVQQLLGFDNRWDTEAWLGDHGANWNYSQEDFEIDGEYVNKRAMK